VDALLEAELRSTRAGKKGNGASQTGRSAQPKPSSKTNAGAANTRDGAKAAAPAEKSQSAQAKKTKKRSALSKRKP
jgi:hypothetical protein